METKIETMTIEFPEWVRFPKSFVRVISYQCSPPRPMQCDVDYVLNDSENVMYIESKQEGLEVQGQQRKSLEVRCKLDCYCSVFVNYKRPDDQNYIEMVDGWSQTVHEYYWKGKWWTDKQGMNLKEFVNWFFSTNWNHQGDIIT